MIKRCLFLQCLHNVTNSAYLVKLNPPQFYLSTNCHMKKSIFRIVKRPLSTPPPSLNCSSCPAHFMFRYELGQHVKKTHLGLPDRPPWVKRCPKCTFASSLETEVRVVDKGTLLAIIVYPLVHNFLETVTPWFTSSLKATPLFLPVPCKGHPLVHQFL